MKIAILGYSGSGKSTLAKRLAAACNIPLLHLDQVQFEAGWVERDREEAAALVERFMEREDWVIDGNYRDFSQQRRLYDADYIIFLDFNRTRCLWRAFKRYCANRNRTREDMAEGCIEKMDLAFILWILRDGRTKSIRQHNQAVREAHADKTVRIKTQRQMDRWLSAFTARL